MAEQMVAQLSPGQIRRTALFRVAVGLAWGLAVSWLLQLEHGRKFTGYEAFYVAGVAAVGSLPFVLLGSIGRLRLRTLLIWAGGGLVIAALCGAYDFWRDPVQPWDASPRHTLSFAAVMTGAAWFFIAHHLIEPADAERRLYPSYRGLFESAWRNAFQIALATAFAGLVLGLLNLGGLLFKVIGIDVISKTLGSDWVYPGVLAISFAAAIHLTDVRPGVIRSVRTLALGLPWALPLLTIPVAGFLIALSFTGLKPLWGATSAAVILLGTAAFLVLLINAAYQDGRQDRPPPGVLRWAARVASLALVPLVALAAYADGLRVNQYGLSPERV